MGTSVLTSDRADFEKLLTKLRSLGISSNPLLNAFAKISRRLFIAAPYQAGAYADEVIPIECGQTLSAPSTIARMLQALDIEAGQTVLEVGCGSGYQAALLASLGCRVVTLDRFKTLVELAESRFSFLKLSGIKAVHADGLEGFARHAPYDRIIMDGAVSTIPSALMDQLADKGILLAPLGKSQIQNLTRITRDGRLFQQAPLFPVRFTALRKGTARQL